MSGDAWGLLAVNLVVLFALAWPLGAWIARISSGALPRSMHAVEKPLCRAAGTSAETSMNWSQYALAFLAFNALGVLTVYLLQRVQGVLPFNPAGMAAIT